MTHTSSPERTIPFTRVYNAVLERNDLNPFEVTLYVAIARHVVREQDSLTELSKSQHCFYV